MKHERNAGAKAVTVRTKKSSETALRRQKAIFTGLFGMVIFLLSDIAYAQVSPVTNTSGLKTLMCNIINWMIWILLAVSIIMVIMAAFQYVTAGDNVEKTTKGRKTLTYAAIGIAIVLISKGFPFIVASVVGGDASGFSCGSSGAVTPGGTAGGSGTGSSGSSASPAPASGGGGDQNTGSGQNYHLPVGVVPYY